MNSNDEILSAVPDQDAPEIDELDDVEGHGLKEVVVGLSAAAVLGGGVASAANSIPPIGGDLKSPGAATALVQDVQDDAGTLAAPVVNQADRTAAAAQSAASRTVSGGVATAKGAVTTVDDAAASALTKTGGTLRTIVADPTGYATDATRPTVQKAGSTADRGIGLATSTAQGAGAAAQALADDAAGMATSALKVLSATVDSTSKSTTDIVLGLRDSDVDAGAKASSRDAWVVAKVGNEVVGSAQMDGGRWTVTIESRHLSSPITFSVGGHEDIAPLTVHMSV